jgi:hypothetical protein
MMLNKLQAIVKIRWSSQTSGYDETHQEHIDALKFEESLNPAGAHKMISKG